MPDFKLDVGLLLRDQAYGGAIVLDDRKAYLQVGTTGYLQSDKISTSLAAPAPKYDNGMTKTAGMFFINPNSWRKNTKIVGDADIAGEPTTHVTAEIRADRFFRDVARLVDLLTSLRITEISGLPTVITPKQQAALVRSVKSAKADVYFGKDDHVLRKARLDGSLVVAKKDRKVLGGMTSATAVADFNLTEVGESQPRTSRSPRTSARYADLQLTLDALGESIDEGARHESDAGRPVARDAPSLVVRGVAKSFGDREAVQDVSFDVARGELLAIIGPNGAGKTTLLTMLAGIREPDSGTVAPAGPERRQADRLGARSRRRSTRSSPSPRTCACSRAWRRSRISTPSSSGCSSRPRSTSAPTTSSARLSGGNRQRVNIAVGLLADPPVLLLDEPSGALDPRQRQRLWGFITALTERGTSVVFATHDIAEAERHADRVLVLADGELLFNGTAGRAQAAAQATEGQDIEQAFVGFLRARGH